MKDGNLGQDAGGEKLKACSAVERRGVLEEDGKMAEFCEKSARRQDGCR